MFFLSLKLHWLHSCVKVALGQPALNFVFIRPYNSLNMALSQMLHYATSSNTQHLHECLQV